LTAPDGVARFVSDLSLPRDSDGPVFVEPWQAQAFALTVRLHAAGCFTWTEWVDTLAGVLREVRKRGEPDDGSHYYAHWLVALERLVTAKQVLDAAWAAGGAAPPRGLSGYISESANFASIRK
jgi:nitrile hydratase accessory protein